MALIEPLQLARQGRFPAASTEFTALDFETTGLTPGHVLEVAAVRVRPDGTVLGELSTLVNPGAGIDPGPTHAHHITRAELDRAPQLSAVLAQIVEMCRGSVLVAHNLPFETRFLTAELDRLGVRLPQLQGVCLQAVARQLFRLPNYRLATVAGALGIGEFPPHLALGGARVSARVVSALVTVHGLAFTDEPRLPKLPRLPGGGRLSPRAELGPVRQTGWMAELVDRLPEDPSAQSEADLGGAYRELLADALADRHLSEAEAVELARLAASAGMTPAAVRHAHVEFVAALRHVAEGDGIVTTEEEHDLRTVAGLLGVGEVLADLRASSADTPRARPSRVLMLGDSAAADELRAEILDAGIQLAKKLTSSVTHLVVGREVPVSEPRIERAVELGATVVDLASARDALGLATTRIPAQTAVMPSSRPVPQAFPPPPPPPPVSRPWPPVPRAVDPVDRLGTVAGWVLVGIGLLIMFITVIAAFGGMEVAPALVASVLGVGSLLGGWWLTERHRTQGAPIR